MGLKRKTGQLALCLAMIICPAAAGAASPGEPLVVTNLGNPELLVITQGAPAGTEDPALGGAMRGFASAINEAAAADQESIAARCKSIVRVPANGAFRDAWEANCRYLRR